MENSFTSSVTDPLLLLKERIIKTETLLDKYACLTRKFNDLEKSHSQAVENEKKAKRDAIKYLEKYCKLAKKSNTLLIKIKSLEDSISIKSNELKESQDEYAKLESVLQVYKTERKGYQCLKKDRDFLLAILWRLLKRLEEEPKEYKIKKITETFFKKFERELMDLKLEDFRYNKEKNVAGLTEKEESEFLFSPGSHVLDSVESDFIDTDLAPESVKSSYEEFDTNCMSEGMKPMDSMHRTVDTEQKNDIKTVEVNVVENQPLPLPDLSFEPFPSRDLEGRIDSNLQEKDILKDCTYINTLEDNGFNLCQDGIEEDDFTSLTSFNFAPKGDNISDTLMQNKVQDQGQCSQDNPNFNSICLLTESKDDVKNEEKITEQSRKTYCSRKLKASQEDEIVRKKSGSPNGRDEISNTIANDKSTDIDIFNVSSETIGLDTDVCVEDIGSIPDNLQYCERIYDFLTLSEEVRYPKESSIPNEDSYLLFSTEKELGNTLTEVNFDSEKTIIRKSSKTISVFDVEDGGKVNSMSSECARDEELANTCVEFNSDNGNTIELKEVTGKVFEGNEKNNLLENDGISRKPENESKVDEKSHIPNSGIKESNNNCNSNQFVDSMIKKNNLDSELTQQENIPDEEVYRILKHYQNVPLLSPIKEKDPNKRRKLFVPETPKLDKSNAIQNVKVLNNLKNMKPCGDILHNRPNKREELLCIPKTNNEREKKMVDKMVQTDGKEFLDEREVEQQSNGISEKMIFSEALMKKLCKIVWKKNFKKLKYLNNFAKMCKIHSSCFDFMKTLLEMINRPRLYFKNTRGNSHFMKAKTGQNKSNLKCDERKMSSWQVEDVDVTNVISKNEPLFNYPKVEDCSFFTQVPVHYYSKDRLNDSAVKSEETRGQKNKMSFNCFTHHQQIGFAPQKRRELENWCNACECNSCWECGVDSDVALLHCGSSGSDTVNNFEKRCDSSAGTLATTNDLENTPKPNLENIPEIDITDDSSNTVPATTEYLEKCVEVKKTEFQSREACSKTEESVLLLRRSSRIRSRNTQVTKEDNHSLTVEESHNLGKVDFFGVSLPHTTDNSTESVETSSSTSINDTLPIKKVSEDSKSSTLKNKFEELFGNSEWQSDSSSSESSKIIEPTLTPTELQKQASVNFQINENGYTSDATTGRIKRKVRSYNSKPGSSDNKKTKLDQSIRSEKEFEEKFTENEVPANDTFSSPDITTGDNSNVLDSIMTAMTKQTEFFKVQTTVKETEVSDANYRSIRCAPQPSLHRDGIPSDSVHRKISNECKMKGDKSAFLNLPYYWSLDNSFGNQTVKEQKGTNNSVGNHGQETKLKSLVQKEIRNFVKIDISTVEEGEEKVKSCVAVLRKASENIIANAIVNEIMANVDEELQEFERPAPPLTQTQHRIMIILTVFSNSDEQFHRISNQILNIIWSKIFPENFFWPDDSLEMATRFYSALCKRLNNFKGMWKFCFKVITSMRQRWCIPIFVVLQVWPDIIHNESEVQNNILVKTFVNIILHTPKSEDMRRKRQEHKLLAVKHLLINFYNFDLNSTIEGFTQTLWESFVDNTPGSVDALVLMSKCRNWSWTRKNIIAKLLETLQSWMNGNGPDIMVSKALDILQQITVIFPYDNAGEVSSAKDVTSALAEALNAERLNPILSEKVIRILCSLCHYSDVRDILVRFLEKISTSYPLYADIKKALSSKNRKPKGYAKTKKKAVAVHMKKKPKKKEKKKKGNSSRQKSVLDIKSLNVQA